MKRELSTIVPATLLKSLSLMGNFLVIFQESKNKKIVSQAYKWCKYVCDEGVTSSFLWL